MKPCKSCGKEISKKAKTCPNCGRDQRNFFMRHKIITGFLILVAIIFIGALGSGEDQSNDSTASNESNSTASNESENTEQTSTEDDASEESSENEELDKTEFAIGEPAELNGQVVQVTEVTKSNGNQFDTPSEGNEYVIVNVTIDNNGDKEISYNPFNFKMKNSNGQIEDQGLIMVDQDTSLSSGQLAPGGTVSGTLSFEQPIDDSGLQLIFEPSFWNEEQIIFNVSQ
jgi:Telomeric repeat-binding factor 2.